ASMRACPRSGGSCMFAGVSVALGELPVELIERHGLRRCVHDRGGEPELRFLLADAERVLPVWLDGQLQIVRWGNRRGQSRGLPCTAWTWLATVEAGAWAALGGEPVVLCELQGRGRREAARQLGIPEGTLSSRLAAARKLLAKRLARYGLAVTGGTLAEVQ